MDRSSDINFLAITIVDMLSFAQREEHGRGGWTRTRRSSRRDRGMAVGRGTDKSPNAKSRWDDDEKTRRGQERGRTVAGGVEEGEVRPEIRDGRRGVVAAAAGSSGGAPTVFGGCGLRTMLTI